MHSPDRMDDKRQDKRQDSRPDKRQDRQAGQSIDRQLGGLTKAGIRELRNSVSDLVRRAGQGERIVITVDGRPMAQLGPLQPDAEGVTLHDLAGAGLIQPPAAAGEATMPDPYPVPADVRVDRLIDQIRGA